jgi:alkylation response protein AidB-like acyl-CoA dehydrogenase
VVDLTDSAEDAQFRADLQSWLRRVLVVVGPEPHDATERLAWWRRWQREVAAGGYAGIGWPREYGGRGAGVVQQAIFYEECDLAGAPLRLNVIGEGMAGPTIIEHGTDGQKRRFLAGILDGSELWCQLFSEPEAGSDLAALRTRARRHGDGWLISGHKIWTSNAHNAEYAILLARTSDAPRHGGITYFLLPVRQAGVTVAPLRHMLGEAEFNEVLLEDVYVPDELRVGEVDDGWSVAMATLGYERAAIATGRVNTRRVMDGLIALVRASSDDDGRPLGEDAVVRQRIADLYCRTALQRLTGQRILSGAAEGRAPGPEASTAKLFTAPLVEDLADFGISVLGLAGQQQPDADNAGRSRWLRLAYQGRGTSIAGGTTFIQRNIVAERVLGLPRT